MQCLCVPCKTILVTCLRQLARQPIQQLGAPITQEAKKAKKFQGLIKQVEKAKPGQELDDACQQLQAIVAELTPAKNLLKAACTPPAFDQDQRPPPDLDPFVLMRTVIVPVCC